MDKSDLLQGTLDMLILKVVALGPIHGYGIALRIQQISKDALQVQQGSLYPALRRLEHRGWLTAKWGQSESGREARLFVDQAGEKAVGGGNGKLGAAGGSDRTDHADIEVKGDALDQGALAQNRIGPAARCNSISTSRLRI